MNFDQKFRFCPACGSGNFTPNNVKSMRCSDCGFVWYMNPSAAVAAFILNDKGELLVCRRAKEPAKGTFDLPGGFTDNAETAEEAIAREVMEETGIRVVTSSYLFSLPNLYLYSELTIPTMDLFFECVTEELGQLKPADDVESCLFIPVSSLQPDEFGLVSIKKAIEIYKKSSASFRL